MREYVTRPAAPDKKIDCHEEFELCYLRHQYLRRVNFNPSDAEMSPYYPIVRNLAKKTFYTYFNLFQMVGMDLEDVTSIGKVQIISYVGGFSIAENDIVHDRFIDMFQERHLDVPDAFDIQSKEKANFTVFLKQRFADLVRVCRQKAVNIKGLPTQGYMVYAGVNPPPTDHKELDRANKKYGYKKVDISNFKTLKKRMKGQDGPVYQYQGKFYVTVPVEHKTLSITDFICAGLDPREGIHNMTPEQVMLEKADQLDFETKKAAFLGRSSNYRNRKIKEFISLHKDNPSYNEEVRAARKMLKSKGV